MKNSILGTVCAFLTVALLWGALWIATERLGKTDTDTLTEMTDQGGQDDDGESVVSKQQQQVTSEYEEEPEYADLQEEICTILENGTQSVFAGYAVDEAFLLWVQKNYGDDAIYSLAEGVTQNSQSEKLWYEVTESSIHVLWMEYCRDTGLASYQLRNVRWMDCASEDVITMDFIGDINFGEEWDTMRVLDARGGMLKECVSEEILSELSSADIAMANNEFTLSTGGTAIEGKSYVFRADPLRAKYYKTMGIDIVSLANNHTWDYGEEALFDTIETLKQEEISYVGAGMNIEEASIVPYFIANGRKIAIVSATQIERYRMYTQQAGSNSAGVIKTLEPSLFISIIEETKTKSDYVIAYVHWGTEGNLYPDEDERTLAQQFIDAGADVVIGGHAHRLQGASFIDGKPVLYSLGNFWFSDGDLYTTIAHLTIQKDGALSLSLIPCEQKNLTVSMLTEQEQRDSFYEYIADLSSGVGITRDGTVHDMSKEQDLTELPDLAYWSGQKYHRHHGDVDLQGKSIDIVGNVK